MTDPPTDPLVELDHRQVTAMLAPMLGGRTIRDVARIRGGLVNTVYRVATSHGGDFTLRIFAGGRPAFERERRLLAGLPTTLPTPRVVLADASGSRCPLPYLVYRWIEGETLTDFRRHASVDALHALAEPLGRTLARIGAVRPARDLPGWRPRRRSAAARAGLGLPRTEERLRRGLARERLGEALADALRARLESRAPHLEALEADALVHGDFGGRNVLVRLIAADRWEVSGVIDWESASVGTPLWDVGGLFRHPRRYPAAFREAFARAHREAGGALPDDWWPSARLLDATRMVSILASEHDRPDVFAECRVLLAAVVADDVAPRG